MKKVFAIAFSVIAMSFLFVSCNHEQNVQKDNDTIDSTSVVDSTIADSNNVTDSVK